MRKINEQPKMMIHLLCNQNKNKKQKKKNKEKISRNKEHADSQNTYLR